MKKISLLVLICMLLSVVFMACDKNVAVCPDPSAHESNESDATDATDATDKGDDGKDDPAVPEHKHSFAEAWSFDATNHYYVCECGEKKDSAAHADANNDGACDACAIIMSNTHVFDKEWTSDTNDHWHAALCGHDVVDGKEAHKADSLGFCSVCGYKVSKPDMTTVSKALAVATLAQNKVVSGTLYANTAYFSEETNYVFGNGTLQSLTVNPDGTKTVYASINEDGTVCYVLFDTIDSMNPVTIIPDADAECIAGPAIDLMNSINQSVVIYGAPQLADFFFSLYPEALAIEGLEVKDEVKDGVYTYTYTFEETVQYMGTYKNTISVEFTLDADYYYIDYLVVDINKEGSYSTDRYTFTYEQRIEDKVYTPDTVVPSEITFKDNNGEAITFTDGKANTINANIGAYTVTLEVVAPDTAFLEAFGEIAAIALDADGKEVSGAYIYYEKSTQSIKATFSKAGTYYVNIALGDNTYVIPFNVTWKTPTADDFTPAIESGWDWVAATDMTKYVGESVEFIVNMGAGCELNKYTAALKTATENATLTSNIDLLADPEYFGDVNGDGNNDLMYTFTATVAGEYVVVFTSTVDETVTKEIKITVEEAISVEDVLAGKWSFSETNNWGETLTVNVNFYVKEGILVVDVINSSDWGVNLEQAIYAYEVVDGQLVATFISGSWNGEPDAYHADSTVVVNSSFKVQFNDYVLELVSETPDVFDGELPEVPGGGDTPGTSSPALPGFITVTEDATFTYQVTLAAGASQKFYIDNYTNGADYNIVVSSGVIGYDLSQTPGATAGTTDTFEAIECLDYYLYLEITNNGIEDATIVVTITVSNAIPIEW